jgi:hypothetical protein
MSAQRGSSSTHTTQQHADDAEESPADSGDDVQGLPSTGVAMQRTVGGGDGVTVRVQTSDDGNSVLSSAVFSRGNGDVDIDYFLAAVSLDAPFIWGGLTCALCARGRAITDTTLSGEVTEIVQHSGVYIHVSAKRGVVQRLQQLGVPVRPAKSANSLVVAEVVVAADTLRAALASAGVDYVLIERVGGKVDVSAWAAKVLPYVVENSVLVVDVGSNHGRRRLDPERLGYVLLPPRCAGGAERSSTGGEASAAPRMVSAVNGGDDMPVWSADPYIAMFRVNSGMLPRASRAQLSATDQLQRGYGYNYEPVFRLASGQHRRGADSTGLRPMSGDGRSDAVGCGQAGDGSDRGGSTQGGECIGGRESAAGGAADIVMEPHDRRWLECSVDVAAVPVSVAAAVGDSTALSQPVQPLSESVVDQHCHGRLGEVMLESPRVVGTVQVHQMFSGEAAAALAAGGVIGGVNFALEVSHCAGCVTCVHAWARSVTRRGGFVVLCAESPVLALVTFLQPSRACAERCTCSSAGGCATPGHLGHRLV